MWRYAAFGWFLLIATPHETAAQTYTATVAPGVSPQLTAAEVAQRALEAQQRPLEALSTDLEGGDPQVSPAAPVVRSVACVAEEDLATIDPRVHGQKGSTVPVWFVRMDGSFVSLGAPGRPPVVGNAGYYLIDDRTGVIFQYGIFPEDQIQKSPAADDPSAPTKPLPPRSYRSEEQQP